MCYTYMLAISQKVFFINLESPYTWLNKNGIPFEFPLKHCTCTRRHVYALSQIRRSRSIFFRQNLLTMLQHDKCCVVNKTSSVVHSGLYYHYTAFYLLLHSNMYYMFYEIFTIKEAHIHNPEPAKQITKKKKPPYTISIFLYKFHVISRSKSGCRILCAHTLWCINNLFNDKCTKKYSNIFWFLTFLRKLLQSVQRRSQEEWILKKSMKNNKFLISCYATYMNCVAEVQVFFIHSFIIIFVITCFFFFLISIIRNIIPISITYAHTIIMPHFKVINFP